MSDLSFIFKTKSDVHSSERMSIGKLNEIDKIVRTIAPYVSDNEARIWDENSDYAYYEDLIMFLDIMKKKYLS